ncbi:MAG: HNH endonuclease [Acidobacteria bacterium]|nr:HNH endonuclease [Acidobacteriota bacterium]
MNMALPPAAEEQVRFLLNLQRLLEEGSFVATYKHALLLSIADVCVEKGDDAGGRFRISTAELAEKFITYYWRQAVPYYSTGRNQAGAVLKQNTGRQAAVISAISKAREDHGNSLAQLKMNPPAWEALKRRVTETIRVMPLWKLQTVGGQKLEFLYVGVRGDETVIELKEGVCYCLRLFYGLVHELVRGAWLRFVRSINENKSLLGTASDLSDFMFGSGRAALEVYRQILIEYQHGNCFYCLRPLKDRSDVDHFIPWSRYPVDFGHNFVLAHGACNTRKADRLAAVEHLEKWCERNEMYGEELTVAFQERNIVHDQKASWRVTAWAYEQAQLAGSFVWRQDDELVKLTSAWRTLLR